MFTVIGTGRSLTKQDCEKAKEKSQIIAVNDAYKILPNAQFHYACDCAWWDIHYDNVKKIFNGLSYTINDISNDKINPNKDYDLIRVRSMQSPDLGQKMIHYGVSGGGNSGYQAINLAYILGAKTIVLLGFDMCGDHFFGKHPNGLRNESPYRQFIQSFESITKKIEIINCTRRTALNCFPKMCINDVLT